LKSIKNIFLSIVLLLDLAVVRTSLHAAIKFYGTISVHPLYLGGWSITVEFFVLWSLAAFVCLFFYLLGLYHFPIIRSIDKQFGKIVIGIIYSVAGLSSLGFFMRSKWMSDSRLEVLYFVVISIALLISIRVILLNPLYALLVRKRICLRRVILVGDGPLVKTFIEKLGHQPFLDMDIIGMVAQTDVRDAQEKKQLPLLGVYTDIPSIVSAMHIDEAIITLANSSHEELLNIIDVCRGLPITTVIATPHMEMIYSKIDIESYVGIPVVVLPALQWKSLMTFVKRCMDILLATVGLILLWMPMVILGVLVKVTSAGPVIFRQVRVGKDGKEFIMYKYRTMIHQDNSEIDVDQFESGYIPLIQVGSLKTVARHLLTPIGSYLRKTSLDELPQLVNVIKGEMSLVGPRPGMVKEYRQYKQWHKRRLSVLPGCTGLWQVTSRGEGDFSQMVLLDLYYINNGSLAFDLRLILRTIPVMLFGKGGK